MIRGTVDYTWWAKKKTDLFERCYSAMVTRRKVCDMSKVSECCRQKEPSLNSKSFKYSLLIFLNLY